MSCPRVSSSEYPGDCANGFGLMQQTSGTRCRVDVFSDQRFRNRRWADGTLRCDDRNRGKENDERAVSWSVWTVGCEMMAQPVQLHDDRKIPLELDPTSTFTLFVRLSFSAGTSKETRARPRTRSPPKFFEVVQVSFANCSLCSSLLGFLKCWFY